MARTTKADREIIDAAVKRLKRAVEADNHNREAAIDDLNFCNGEQWDPKEKKKRADKGRPALQFNYLQKFIDQVVGDMLHNTPQIKIRPVDSKADINIAKIRQGIISNVEYLSNAKSIYGYGARQQVSCGYGAWRVLTRYTDDNPFLQEAYIESIRNPFLVYLDPDSKDRFYADAKFGFVMERMNKERFRELYPRGQWPSDSFQLGSGLSSEHWYDGDTLTVAEYFTIETVKTAMVQLVDGSTVAEEEFKEMQFRWREKNEALLAKMVPAAAAPQPPAPPQGVPPGPPPPQGMPPMAGREQQPGPQIPGPPLAQGAPNPLAAAVEALGPEPRAAKRRETDRSVVRHRTITALEILDGGTEGNLFPGKFIPIVLVKGKELNIEGKNYVYSLIRHAKDPQKMANYWYCLSLSTKLPTPSGWTTMGEAQAGDTLFDEWGNPCTVLGVSPVHEGRACYRVLFDDGNFIDADDSHRWRVEEFFADQRTTADRQYTSKVVTTLELSPGNHAIYNTLPLSLPETDLLAHPYVLGAWLGDGNAASGKLTAGRDDYESLVGVLDAFDDLDAEVGKVTIDHSNGGSASIRIVELTTALQWLGVLGNKHIPIEYLRASYEQRLLLLQGLMDTDGAIHEKNFVCTFTNTNERLIDGVKELLHSLGIRFSVTQRLGRPAEFTSHGRTYTSMGKTQWQINFTAPTDKQVFRLPRKLEIQQKKDPSLEQPRRTSRRKVVSVTPIESVPTKCVAVNSPSRLFLAGEGMIPTHNTNAAETIALAPKTPWVGTAKQFEGYEGDYAAANVENFPFLKYNADPDAQGPPQRTGPPQPPAAIFEMLRKSEDSIKSVIGMFNADVGAPGSEQTGAAITARQRPGDIATFEFAVNMAGAVEHTGRILNDMIPEVYDSERDVRLRNIDETETFMPVNTTVGAAMKAVKARPEIYGVDPTRLSQMVAKDGKGAKFNDITVGKYDVVVTTGPSYSTQRQEAAQFLQALVQSAPQQMAVALDLIVRNMDFKDADELESRLRKPLLTSGMVKPKPGEQIPPAQPDPKIIEAQAEMAKVQSQTQVAQMRVEQEKMKLEQQKVRLAMEIAWLQQETGKKDVATVLGAVESQQKHALEAERIRLERERLDHQRRIDSNDLALRASEQYHARKAAQKTGGAN